MPWGLRAPSQDPGPYEPYETPEYQAIRDRVMAMLEEQEQPFTPKKMGVGRAFALGMAGQSGEGWYQDQVEQHNAQQEARRDRLNRQWKLMEMHEPKAPMYVPGRGLYDLGRGQTIPGTEPIQKPSATDRYLHGGDDLYDTQTGRWIQNPSPSGGGGDKKSPWPMAVPPGYNVIGPDKSGALGSLYTAPGGKPVQTPEDLIQQKVNDVWLQTYQGVIANATKDPAAAGYAGDDPTTLRRRAIAMADAAAEDYRARMPTPAQRQSAVGAAGAERQRWSPSGQQWPAGVEGGQGQAGPPAGGGAGRMPGSRIPENLPPAEDTAFWDAVEQRALQLTMAGMDEDEATEQAILDMMDFLQAEQEGQ